MNRFHKISGLFIPALIFLAGACADKSQGPSKENAPAVEIITEVKASMSGEEIYKGKCLACHQAKGQGVAGSFPPLASSDFLKDKEKVIEQVIKGNSGEMVVNGVKYKGVMPPQALSDEEISRVLGYINTSWGNKLESISPEKVKEVREKLR